MIYHCEYFGYNSLLTQHGTRIRRLRRTEASAEKIAYARIRSPPITSQQYINHGYIRENRSSEVQHSHTNSRSKLSFRFVTGPHINNGPSKEESSRQEISRGNPNGLESQNCSSYRPETQSKQSIKDSVAQYYLKNSTTQNIHSKSKRGLRRLQSHDSSTQSVRRTLTNNRPKPLQQSQQLCKTSNLPYIPRCINKQLLQNQKAAAHKRKLQQIQASMKSSIYNQVQSRKASKKMSSMNGSVVSRSSCVSKSAKEENLSVEDNYRDSKNESQVNEYSQLASDYGLEKSRLNNLKHFAQIPVYLSRKDLKSSQQSMLSKKSSNEVSKMDISVKKLNMELSHLSQIKSHSKLSKLSNQVEVQCQVKQKTANDKLQKCHKTDQSYKTNETDKHLVFDFNRTNSKPHEKITMSGSKRLSNNQKVILTSQKEKRSIKFNPQTKAATHQYISTPQKHSTSSKISQQSLTSSVKSGKQKQNRSSMANKLSTLSTLLKQIEQHQMRLGFIYLFIDNTEQTYKGGLQFQRYERLCFLMFKKYLFEMNRIVVALRGGPNCFTLSGIQVKAERLHSYINSSLFSDKINDCLDQIQQLYKKLEIESHRISKKYNKDKLMRLQYTKDNFTQQIVKLLMQELTKLYQELQSEQMQHKQVEETQKRITEIIEIMFLLSELKGRKVKNFELLSQHSIDFNDYYALHYQKIIETHQFFQKLNE